jgi:hydrogenase maturation protein HypF
VELEAAADPAVRVAYPLPGTEVLDARETLVAILADLGAGVPVAEVAAKFHNAVAEGTARACAGLARAEGIELAVLSGGVFQNRLLLERTAEALERAALRVLVPRLLPPNDGGVAFGQAAVAAAA